MSKSNAFDLDSAAVEIARLIEASPHAERLMNVLCDDVGPRPAGSPAIRLAQEILAREWARLGATAIRREEVPVLFWRHGEAVAETVSPFHRLYRGEQCLNTGSGAVEGRLLNAGKGSEAEVSALGETASGAVLLVKGHEISGGKFEPLQKRLAIAQEAGAAAVLLVSAHPELPSVEVVSPELAIPVVAISGKDAQELARVCDGREACLRVKTSGKATSATCANLVGEMAPDHAARDVIILSAHLDSHYLSSGAFDNLTGVVTLTEIARSLAPFRNHFRRVLRLIAFTAEELGLPGSKEYVRAHAHELNRIRFVLNLDSLFDSTAEGIAVMWAPEMRDYIHQTLERTHPEVDVRNHFCMSSDYLPFMLEGIAAARPADWKDSFPPWSHTIEDTADKIPPAWLKANALALAPVLLKMLTHPRPLPSRRKTRAQVRALIAQEKVEEPLRWQGMKV